MDILTTPVYKPLDPERRQIRLLHLQPGSGDSALNFALEVASLLDESLSKYEAISYCWDTTARDRIDVGNGTRKPQLHKHPRPAGTMITMLRKVSKLATKWIAADGPGSQPHNGPSSHLHGDGQESPEKRRESLETSRSDPPRTIPTSTLQALRRFRHQDAVRTLWIDAICINQSLISERNQQVTEMRTIYSKAERTLAWLGEDDGTVAASIASVNAILKHVRSEASHQQLHTSNDDESLSSTLNAQALHRLFSRPWFTRVWVQQEVVLARHAICVIGSHQIEWKDLAQAGQWIALRSRGPNFLVHPPGLWVLEILSHLRKPGTETSAKADWFDILSLAYNLQCTDPRDQIYGFLGLLPESTPFPSKLRPDYAKSTTEVSRDITRVILEASGDLECLGFVNSLQRTVEQTRRPAYCSWAIQLEHHSGRLEKSSTLSLGGYRADEKFPSKLNGRPDRSEDLLHNLNLLCLEGYCFGQVGMPLQLDSHTNTAYDVIEALLRHPEVHCNDTHHIMRLVRTLCADSWLRGSTRKRLDRMDLTLLERFASALSEACPSPSTAVMAKFASLLDDGERERFEAICEGVGYHCEHRSYSVIAPRPQLASMSLAREGWLALVPETVQPEDVVAILFGGLVPFILRRHGAGFTLIGECYVENAMDGQIVKHCESFEIEPEVISIR